MLSFAQISWTLQSKNVPNVVTINIPFDLIAILLSNLFIYLFSYMFSFLLMRLHV